MAQRLRGKLTGKKVFDSGSSVCLRFTLTNFGDVDLDILKWNTPLEGADSDCFLIRRNGQSKISYDGPLIKRGPILSSDFFALAKGRSKSININVSDSYDVSRAGKYELSVKVDKMEAWLAEDMAPRTGRSVLRKKSLLHVSCRCNTFRFSVRKGVGRVLTRGQVARRLERTQSKLRVVQVSRRPGRPRGEPQPPRIVGGSPTQRSQVQRAHRQAYTLCLDALAALADNEVYKEWFGAFRSSRAHRVEAVFSRIIARMESESFAYDLRGKSCPGRATGFTFKRSTSIWFCAAFWNANESGLDSQAGAVIHEHSHCSGQTEDIAYGISAARALAANAPSLAIQNADNYEYFASSKTTSSRDF